jgi:hypothetical protein
MKFANWCVGLGIGKHKPKNFSLLLMCLLSLLAAPEIQAEPPVHLSPGDILLMLKPGRSVSPPIKLQATCSAEIGACWEAQGLNKENMNRVFDACWEKSKKCPKVCKDEYFSRRKAGMNPIASDPLFNGRRGEDTSCVPGVDELTHPTEKVKVNDSTVRVTVTVGGQPAGTDVYAIPVDAQGHEKQTTTSSPNYSKSNVQSAPPGPISLNLPAGRYQLRVQSQDRFYNRTQAFPDQMELVTVKTGQTLDKTYAFGMGRLVVKARSEDGKPVAVMLTIAHTDQPDYGQRIPLDAHLLAGKYRLVVRETKSRRKKAYDIEIKADRTVTKTITFTSGSHR